MKKIVYGLLATITGLVLLFSYRTSLNPVLTAAPLGAANPGAATTPSSSGTGSSNTGSSSGSSTGSGSGSSTKSSPATSSGWKAGTFTGQTSQTPYGPLQVKITVAGGRITAVDVPVYPQGSGRDQQINSYALPQLVQQTVAAQSANVDMVSGATYTSEGYQQSLQSAIDQAKA